MRPRHGGTQGPPGTPPQQASKGAAIKGPRWASRIKGPLVAIRQRRAAMRKPVPERPLTVQRLRVTGSARPKTEKRRQPCVRQRPRPEARHARAQARSIDQLTGVSLRGVGLREIKRENARARRTHTSLALAFTARAKLANASAASG